MEPVTHIPHQHIIDIMAHTRGEFIITTSNPEDGGIDMFKIKGQISIDDKGIYGLFVKI